MKVKVKTLKKTHFFVEVELQDTVADMKKNIENDWGPDRYPVARQFLIYRGKVLEDDTTLEEMKVVDDDYVVILLSPSTRVPAPPPPPPSSTATSPSNNLHNQEASRDLPPVTEAPPPPAVNPPEATQPPRAPPTVPNTNPLDLFPEALPDDVYIPPITRADLEAIDRLAAMGFRWELAFGAYLACNHNEEEAVNYLRDQMPDQEQ